MEGASFCGGSTNRGSRGMVLGACRSGIRGSLSRSQQCTHICGGRGSPVHQRTRPIQGVLGTRRHALGEVGVHARLLPKKWRRVLFWHRREDLAVSSQVRRYLLLACRRIWALHDTNELSVSCKSRSSAPPYTRRGDPVLSRRDMADRLLSSSSPQWSNHLPLCNSACVHL